VGGVMEWRSAGGWRGPPLSGKRAIESEGVQVATFSLIVDGPGLALGRSSLRT